MGPGLDSSDDEAGSGSQESELSSEGSGDGDGDGDGPLNVYFVTSTLHAGDFAAGDTDPFEVADSICQQRAVVANLDGNFIALISRGDGSAFDVQLRLAEFGASGFRRVDGRFVFSDYDDLSAGRFHADPHMDEFGELVPSDALVWVGPEGPGTGRDCDAWSNSTAMGQVGQAGSTVSHLDSGLVDCTGEAHLLCAQVDYDTPAYVEEQPSGTTRVAFVSVDTTARTISQRDAQCQAEFDAASGSTSGRTFVAAVASPGSSPTARVSDTDASWVRPDGTLISPSTSQMLEGSWTAALIVTAAGDFLFAAQDLDLTIGSEGWTEEGSIDTTCAGWMVTDAGSSFALANPTIYDDRLGTAQSVSCADPSARYYCLEQL